MEKLLDTIFTSIADQIAISYHRGEESSLRQPFVLHLLNYVDDEGPLYILTDRERNSFTFPVNVAIQDIRRLPEKIHVQIEDDLEIFGGQKSFAVIIKNKTMEMAARFKVEIDEKIYLECKTISPIGTRRLVG